MATFIAVEEEQLALIQKLISQYGNTLSIRERQILTMMEEDLQEKIKQHSRLEAKAGRLYMKPHPTAGKGDDLTDVERQQYRAKLHTLRGLSPQDMVKRFVESWNRGDFELEYCCLSKTFQKGGSDTESMTAYVDKRKAKQRQRGRSTCIRKTVKDFNLVKLTGYEAVVDCVELYHGLDSTNEVRRRYVLIYEEGAWRILDFNNLAETEPSVSDAAV